MDRLQLRCWKYNQLGGKKLSQRGTNFPSRCRSPHGRTQQWLGKLQSQQMVTIGMSYPNDFRPQIS